MDMLVEFFTKKEVLIKNIDTRPAYEIKLTSNEVRTLKLPPCPTRDQIIDMILDDQDVPSHCMDHDTELPDPI